MHHACMVVLRCTDTLQQLQPTSTARLGTSDNKQKHHLSYCYPAAPPTLPAPSRAWTKCGDKHFATHVRLSTTTITAEHSRYYKNKHNMHQCQGKQRHLNTPCPKVHYAATGPLRQIIRRHSKTSIVLSVVVVSLSCQSASSRNIQEVLVVSSNSQQ